MSHSQNFRRCSSVFAYNEVSAAIVKKAKYGGGYVYLEFMAEAIAVKGLEESRVGPAVNLWGPLQREGVASFIQND